MGQAIEQGRGHFSVTKHGGPFAEAQVGGNHDAGALVKLAEKLEQQSTEVVLLFRTVLRLG